MKFLNPFFMRHALLLVKMFEDFFHLFFFFFFFFRSYQQPPNFTGNTRPRKRSLPSGGSSPQLFNRKNNPEKSEALFEAITEGVLIRRPENNDCPQTSSVKSASASSSRVSPPHSHGVYGSLRRGCKRLILNH